MRFNNFCFKTIIGVFVMLTTAGIYWKKKRISFKIENHQRNVLTLKQTLGIISLIYCNNVLADYLLASFKPSDLVFLFEEVRVLLVENVLTRFVIPVVLILNTRNQLPGLWIDTEVRRSEFYMTKMSDARIRQSAWAKGGERKENLTKDETQVPRGEVVRDMPRIDIC